MALIVEKET